jgi:hypothetical protein
MQVQCFVQEHIGELLPPIGVAARQEMNLYNQIQQSGNIHQADQHWRNYTMRMAAQVQLLCRLAGQEALNRQAPAMLSVRCMPWHLIHLIQHAGLQVTTAHLVAAARARVEGLECWDVQPYCSELEPMVQAICRFSGGEPVSPQL